MISLGNIKAIMNSKSLNAISNICSGQTVLTLLFTYLIILLYIIPTAHREAIELSGLDLNSISYFQYGRLGIVSHYNYLNDDFRSIYISTEFTAGIFEDFSLFAFIIAFQFFVRSRLSQLNIDYNPKIILALYSFGLDIIQTLASIYLMGLSSNSQLVMYLILFLAVAKIAVYIYITTLAILAWRNSNFSVSTT